MNMATRHSARIRILSCIPEVLLRQPLPLLVILRNVDPFDLENDRPRAVVTAGDHHAVIVSPAFHDGAALKGSVNIPADGIPRLAAEFAVHQVVKIVLLRRTFQDEFVSHIKAGTGTGLWISQILLLVIGKTFLIYNCDFAFVLHTQAPLFQGGAKCLQLFQSLFGHTRIIAIRSKYPHTFKLQIIQKVTLIRKQSAVVHIRISGT